MARGTMRAGPLESTLRAIDGDPAIRVYAALLGASLALTGVSWLDYKNVASLVTGEDCVCWPMWPWCEHARAVLSPASVRFAVGVYMALGLASAGLFLGRRAAAALGAFVGAILLGAAIYALDYRMRQNQTYMLSWAALVLLLARRKAQALQAVVALFYFWAGALKLNGEWLSGAALYARPLLVPRSLLPAACVYVVVLEMVLVWGLFAPWRAVRAAVYAQLLVFHAVSWGVVGYFYPLLMFAITAIYPLVWLRAPDETLTFARLTGDREAFRDVACVGAAFSALQLPPLWFPGDTAATGEGRLFSLTMFEARVDCTGGATVRSRSGGASQVTLINPALDQRMRCDPIVLMAEAERLCGVLASRADLTVDVAVDAKRSGDGAARPLIRADDLCRSDARYSLWHHNGWIGPR